MKRQKTALEKHKASAPKNNNTSDVTDDVVD
jgi:hypothetical protein